MKGQIENSGIWTFNPSISSASMLDLASIYNEINWMNQLHTNMQMHLYHFYTLKEKTIAFKYM
jgi:hypothetical protein